MGDELRPSREPPRPRSWGPVDPPEPVRSVRPVPPRAAAAPTNGPSGLVKAGLVVLLGVTSGLVGLVPVHFLVTSMQREAEAAHDLVEAVRAEADVMAPLARSAADPGPLERAWFAFSDEPSPETAVAVVRQASAVDHESLDPAHHEAIVRLREARDRWDDAR